MVQYFSYNIKILSENVREPLKSLKLMVGSSARNVNKIWIVNFNNIFFLLRDWWSFSNKYEKTESKEN